MKYKLVLHDLKNGTNGIDRLESVVLDRRPQNFECETHREFYGADSYSIEGIVEHKEIDSERVFNWIKFCGESNSPILVENFLHHVQAGNFDRIKEE